MSTANLAAPVVRWERQGRIARIEFSSGSRNHFSTPLLAQLADAFEQAEREPEVNAIVLCSRGRNFCAGADLVDGQEEPATLYAEAMRLFAIRKPIVAAVQGAAIGGGLGLALVADFRIVAPSSRLSANFVKLGIHPGFAMTYTLPRVVGPQRAAELFYTGRRLTGKEAHAIQLADRIVAEDQLLDAALEFACAIAENAPLAVEATRSTLRMGLLEALKSRTEHEAAEQLRLRTTADFAEGIRAVTERRPGNWMRA
ncbi:enoyl-CoA hydratase/isomerase family protein [Hydrocarboniphaga effusa]|jgi:enoyl-CoA hydratase/carnithine racemase|uniref:Enoyl-CoA hydratase/isomerase n=1 Tax=Hydrocarboniphaga effusa AP103 TaxID=1172194 RepID=I7Z7X1_9GAMM|nr:enoyl-CoA hydratase/isomerase family protein [Hydrocarboniphaga effusa]EIT67904.1 enoyl-CoA hydratase/isomerase [Hydrocarboniphaga effusa AP103]